MEREDKLFVQAANGASAATAFIQYLEQRNEQLRKLEQKEVEMTVGGRLADLITSFGGSWGFIIVFIIIISLWVGVNILGVLGRWDPYPFILLNLCLSTLAALQAPIILMSQNRQAQHDRIRAEIDLERDRLDLEIDTFAAKIIREMFLKLEKIEQRLGALEKKKR